MELTNVILPVFFFFCSFYHEFDYGVFLIPSTVKDRQPVKSLVVGRPILLALEDIDGTPSFLEKALRFMEERGKFSFFLQE